LTSAEAQRSAVESRANELIRERTQAEAAAVKAQESFYKTDKELGFMTVERDTLLRGGNSEKAEKMNSKIDQTKSKLAQLRRDWVGLNYAPRTPQNMPGNTRAGVCGGSVQHQSQQTLHQ
jgi:hypothetical protein